MLVIDRPAGSSRAAACRKRQSGLFRFADCGLTALRMGSRQRIQAMRAEDVAVPVTCRRHGEAGSRTLGMSAVLMSSRLQVGRAAIMMRRGDAREEERRVLRRETPWMTASVAKGSGGEY